MKKTLAQIGVTAALMGGSAFVASSPADSNFVDYKFWYITKCDDVHICEVAVRFYEGGFEVKQEMDRDTGESKDVVQYVRTEKLKKKDLEVDSKRATKVDQMGHEAIIYTDKDFGVATNTEQIREFLDKELVKNKDRAPFLQAIKNND